ncbi:serine/threonine-protein kinase [Nocardia bovistercoris]|uniref:non-specific serine/threonine protein kinase n=1 Tax=Nocardia bovistercoris TaxID=2785916 RepID=A0A931IFM5_9NOCA|nr:serine/threonine-protein kinase [Nocardia bovistercoris]MBH0780837.1 serine/threonine protein kinase [Nocardia bovistercoris]
MGERWFGHYRLERLLGSGGTSRVWLAHDTRADRNVALKVFATESAADSAHRQRFTREARLAAQLRGPHAVAIHDYGELEGRLYLDMEFVEGLNAAALLRANGPLAPDRAVRIVIQAADALDAAHHIGLVHRDVKPANLMVTPTGFVYLIDFGTATHVDQPPITATGHTVGTLGYLAPERFTGSADARSDQYALACVLFELLTGGRPFGDSDSPEQMHAHLMRPPPAASATVARVPAALDAVIMRGMAKDPDERWPSAGELAAAAHAALSGRDMAAVGVGHTVTARQTRPTLPNVIRRYTMPAASTRAPMPQRPCLAAAALLGLVAVIGGALWLGGPEIIESDSGTPTTRPDAPTHVPSPPVAAPQIAVTPLAELPCELDCAGPVATRLPRQPVAIVPDNADLADPKPPGKRNGADNGKVGTDNPGKGDDPGKGKDKPDKPKK